MFTNRDIKGAPQKSEEENGCTEGTGENTTNQQDKTQDCMYDLTNKQRNKKQQRSDLKCDKNK